MRSGTSRNVTWRVAVAAGAILGLSACGSSGSGGPAEATFVTHADQTCQEALQVMTVPPFPYPNFDPTNPLPAQLPSVGAYLDRVGFNHNEVGVINVIGRPRRGLAGWQRFVTLVEQQQSEVGAQIRAAKASDRAAFVASVASIRATAKQIDAAATTVGFRSNSYCVQLFG